MTDLILSYGYIGLFVTVFLESGIFFALPGDSLLFTAGLLAQALNLNVLVLFLLTFVAGTLGGLIGYVIGKYIDRLRKYKFFRKILKDEYVYEANRFFASKGRAALILARFMPIVRTFMPIAAGVSGMDRRIFTIYTIISAAIWAGVFIFGGYFLGGIFPQLEHYLTEVVILIVFVSLLPGIVQWIKRKQISRQ